MNCPKCNSGNDPDALFCVSCGTAFIDKPSAPVSASRKPYFFALLFIPVIVLAAAFGYYKYFLPQGVAAVVNGEEIKLAELDAAVARIQPRSFKGAQAEQQIRRLRFDVLNQLITERLAFQEARKAGVTVSDQEAEAARERTRLSSGLDDNAFKTAASREYGSLSRFEDAVRRGLAIDKYITSKVVPPGTGLQETGAVLANWTRQLHEKAAVRVTLSEQWSGAGSGCACCNRTTETGSGQMKNSASEAGTSASDEAAAAALRYWHKKHGQEQVTARTTDFGCHFEIDIIKESEKIGSLRYQQGSITEL